MDVNTLLQYIQESSIQQCQLYIKSQANMSDPIDVLYTIINKISRQSLTLKQIYYLERVITTPPFNQYTYTKNNLLFRLLTLTNNLSHKQCNTIYKIIFFIFKTSQLENLLVMNDLNQTILQAILHKNLTKIKIDLVQLSYFVIEFFDKVGDWDKFQVIITQQDYLGKSILDYMEITGLLQIEKIKELLIKEKAILLLQQNQQNRSQQMTQVKLEEVRKQILNQIKLKNPTLKQQFQFTSKIPLNTQQNKFYSEENIKDQSELQQIIYSKYQAQLQSKRNNIIQSQLSNYSCDNSAIFRSKIQNDSFENQIQSIKQKKLLSKYHLITNDELLNTDKKQQEYDPFKNITDRKYSLDDYRKSFNAKKSNKDDVFSSQLSKSGTSDRNNSFAQIHSTQPSNQQPALLHLSSGAQKTNLSVDIYQNRLILTKKYHNGYVSYSEPLSDTNSQHAASWAGPFISQLVSENIIGSTPQEDEQNIVNTSALKVNTECQEEEFVTSKQLKESQITQSQTSQSKQLLSKQQQNHIRDLKDVIPINASVSSESVKSLFEYMKQYASAVQNPETRSQNIKDENVQSQEVYHTPGTITSKFNPEGSASHKEVETSLKAPQNQFYQQKDQQLQSLVKIQPMQLGVVQDALNDSTSVFQKSSIKEDLRQIDDIPSSIDQKEQKQLTNLDQNNQELQKMHQDDEQVNINEQLKDQQKTQESCLNNYQQAINQELNDQNINNNIQDKHLSDIANLENLQLTPYDRKQENEAQSQDDNISDQAKVNLSIHQQATHVETINSQNLLNSYGIVQVTAGESGAIIQNKIDEEQLKMKNQNQDDLSNQIQNRNSSNSQDKEVNGSETQYSNQKSSTISKKLPLYGELFEIMRKSTSQSPNIGICSPNVQNDDKQLEESILSSFKNIQDTVKENSNVQEICSDTTAGGDLNSNKKDDYNQVKSQKSAENNLYTDKQIVVTYNSEEERYSEQDENTENSQINALQNIIQYDINNNDYGKEIDQVSSKTMRDLMGDNIKSLSTINSQLTHTGSLQNSLDHLSSLTTNQIKIKSYESSGFKNVEDSFKNNKENESLQNLIQQELVLSSEQESEQNYALGKQPALESQKQVNDENTQIDKPSVNQLIMNQYNDILNSQQTLDCELKKVETNPPVMIHSSDINNGMNEQTNSNLQQDDLDTQIKKELISDLCSSHVVTPEHQLQNQQLTLNENHPNLKHKELNKNILMKQYVFVQEQHDQQQEGFKQTAEEDILTNNQEHYEAISLNNYPENQTHQNINVEDEPNLLINEQKEANNIPLNKDLNVQNKQQLEGKKLTITMQEKCDLLSESIIKQTTEYKNQEVIVNKPPRKLQTMMDIEQVSDPESTNTITSVHFIPERLSEISTIGKQCILPDQQQLVSNPSQLSTKANYNNEATAKNEIPLKEKSSYDILNLSADNTDIQIAEPQHIDQQNTKQNDILLSSKPDTLQNILQTKTFKENKQFDECPDISTSKFKSIQLSSLDTGCDTHNIEEIKLAAQIKIKNKKKDNCLNKLEKLRFLHPDVDITTLIYSYLRDSSDQ